MIKSLIDIKMRFEESEKGEHSLEKMDLLFFTNRLECFHFIINN
jgi:hypothetical protein